LSVKQPFREVTREQFRATQTETAHTIGDLSEVQVVRDPRAVAPLTVLGVGGAELPPENSRMAGFSFEVVTADIVLLPGFGNSPVLCPREPLCSTVRVRTP
jgi:hypothetical protein